MTTYLPNTNLQPPGSEPAEYIDVPPMAETPGTVDRSAERGQGVRPRRAEGAVE